jgi:hypothetical protein
MLDQWAFGIYGAHLWCKWWLEEVISWWRWWMWMVGDLIVWWRRLLIRDLVVQWSFTPLLAEDLQVVMHLCEPRPLSVDVLSTSLGTPHRGLPSQNGFLFLLEPLDLLLVSG